MFVDATDLTPIAMAAPLKLERVLITDKADPSCEEILKQGGIAVDVKLKLPKDQLLQEIQVPPEMEMTSCPSRATFNSFSYVLRYIAAMQ